MHTASAGSLADTGLEKDIAHDLLLKVLTAPADFAFLLGAWHDRSDAV
jgi:hypothetical protein